MLKLWSLLNSSFLREQVWKKICISWSVFQWFSLPHAWWLRACWTFQHFHVIIPWSRFPRCFVSFNTLHLVSTKARPRILLALCEWTHWWPVVPHTKDLLCGSSFDDFLVGLKNLSVKWEALAHWDQDKMAANFLTTFSNTFSWMKIYEFRLGFHWSLFPRAQLTIFQHWFR